MAEGDDPSEDVLNQFTQLNNELIGLHRELAQANAELTELNARKNQMLGMAAHDLRNPLGAIRGFAETLLALPPEQLATTGRPVLERIVGSSTRMLDLVDDLLTVTEIEAGRVQLDPEEADLADLVDEIVTLEIPAAATKQIEIEVRSAGELRLRMDPDRMGQVIENLVSNAIKYSPAGSRVVITVTTSSDEALLSVADEGVGIPADELDTIFTPFGKASPRTTGGERSTGLGLAIAKRVVEAHAGAIEVTSRPGEGSVFTVRLPRHGIPVTPGEGSPSSAGAPGGSGSG